MKKLISITLCILTIFIFTSCSKSLKIRVFEAGGYDSSSPAQHSSELNLKSITSKKVFIKKEKSFDFKGKNFDTEYIETEKGYLYKEEVNYYQTQDKSAKFGINSDSGNIDYYRLTKPKNYLSDKTTSELSKEECIAVATEYLKTFVDISDYEMRYDRYWDSATYGGSYTFEFHRMIGGLETSDSAIIEVTVFGDIFFHKFTSLSEMKDAELPSEEDMNLILQKVEEKVKGIYQTTEEKYLTSYEISNPLFIRLESGKYALEYSIDVTMTSKNPEDHSLSEVTRIIVTFD